MIGVYKLRDFFSVKETDAGHIQYENVNLLSSIPQSIAQKKCRVYLNKKDLPELCSLWKGAEAQVSERDIKMSEGKVETPY